MTIYINNNLSNEKDLEELKAYMLEKKAVLTAKMVRGVIYYKIKNLR